MKGCYVGLRMFCRVWVEGICKGFKIVGRYDVGVGGGYFGWS